MLPDPDANPEVATEGEPQPETPEPTDLDSARAEIARLKAEREALVGQYKGQQRTNERLRKELVSKVDTEDLREQIRLLQEGNERLVKILEPALDAQSREEVVRLRTGMESAKKKLSEETTAQRKFAEVLADTGVDFDSDEAKVARAFYESGNYSRATEELETLRAKKKNSTLSDAELDALVEKRLKDRGAVVTKPSGSTAGAPIRGRDAAIAVAKNPKATERDVLDAIAALSKGT